MQVRHAAELVSVALFRHGEKLFRKLKANHSQRLLQQCGKSQQLTGSSRLWHPKAWRPVESLHHHLQNQETVRTFRGKGSQKDLGYSHSSGENSGSISPVVLCHGDITRVVYGKPSLSGMKLRFLEMSFLLTVDMHA